MLAPEEETADDDGDDDEGTEDTTDDGPGGRSWSELPLLFWRDGEKTDSFGQHQKRSNAEALCYDGEAEERSDTSCSAVRRLNRLWEPLVTAALLFKERQKTKQKRLMNTSTDGSDNNGVSGRSNKGGGVWGGCGGGE